MSRTILGPLTTIFTPPPECSTLRVWSKTGDVEVDWGASCVSDGPEIGAASSCFPPALGSFLQDANKFFSSVPFYSPASGCPVGFTQACTISKVSDGTPPAQASYSQASYSIWEALSTGETVIGCCPSGYTCGEGDVNVCNITPPSSGESFTGIDFDTNCATLATEITIQAAPSTFVGEAYRVQLMITSPTSTSTGASAETASSTPHAQMSSAAGGNSGGGSTSPGSGLSTGAIAAIGVVIPLVAIIALVGIVFILRRRKKNQPKAHSSSGITAQSNRFPKSLGKPELAGDDGARELDSTEVSKVPELDSSHEYAQPSELYSSNMRLQPSELDSSHNYVQSSQHGSSDAYAQLQELGSSISSGRNQTELPAPLSSQELSSERPITPKMVIDNTRTSRANAESEDNSELENLRAEKAKIEAEMSKLLEMQRLRRDKEEIERKIKDLEGL